MDGTMTIQIEHPLFVAIVCLLAVLLIVLAVWWMTDA